MPDAIVIPGARYGPSAPLLQYAGDAAERRGATVHRHVWSEQVPRYTEQESETWVRGEVLPLVSGHPLLIGKSLGTHAAAIAAERSLPAVWLTPLLTLPWVAGALSRATAPFLLIGGTADPAWNGELARKLSPHVLEVDDADHGMYVPGPLTDSIAVLSRVVAAVEEFLEEIAWPAPGE